MRFAPSPLPGVWTIEHEPFADGRGWFARTFDRDEFAAMGLRLSVVQCNTSFTAGRDTLRGMHYQAEPHGEPKLVRCMRGAAFHVALDLRLDSPTYLGWHGVELNAENLRALYLPPGVAHGFQTLVDNCVALYHMGHRYVPDAARGVRWDDPAFAIQWPALVERHVPILSQRDRSFADWESPEREGSLASSERR